MRDAIVLQWFRIREMKDGWTNIHEENHMSGRLSQTGRQKVRETRHPESTNLNNWQLLQEELKDIFTDYFFNLFKVRFHDEIFFSKI